MPILKEVRENDFFYEKHSEVQVSQILEIAEGAGKFIFSSCETEVGVSPLTLHIWDKVWGPGSYTFTYTQQIAGGPYKWILDRILICKPSFPLPETIDSIDELQNVLEKLGYVGVPSSISKAIESAILGKKKVATSNPIIDKVFSRKIDQKQKFILDLDQVLKLCSLLLNEEGLLPSEKGQVSSHFFRVSKVIDKKELQELALPQKSKSQEYFCITADELNKIISISEPSAELLKRLRELLFMVPERQAPLSLSPAPTLVQIKQELAEFGVHFDSFGDPENVEDVKLELAMMANVSAIRELDEYLVKYRQLCEKERASKQVGFLLSYPHSSASVATTETSLAIESDEAKNQRKFKITSDRKA